jgi:hypothetical protein
MLDFEAAKTGLQGLDKGYSTVLSDPEGGLVFIVRWSY